MDKKRMLLPLLVFTFLGVLFAIYQNSSTDQLAYYEEENQDLPKKNIVIIDPNPSDLYQELEKNSQYNLWYVLPAWLVSSKAHHPYLKDKIRYVEVETLEDDEQVAQALKNLQEIYDLQSIDYILTSDSKTLTQQLPKLCESLGIKGELQAKDVALFSDKLQLKNKLAQANILQPWFSPATKTLPQTRTTFQLTPTSTHDDKPTFGISDLATLKSKDRLINKKKLGQYILVENLKGQTYHIEALIKKGKIIQCKSNLKINIGSSSPTKMEKVAYIQVHKHELKKLVQNIVQALQYKKGGISIQLVQDQEGHIYTTEVTPLTRTMERERFNLLLGQTIKSTKKKVIDFEICYKAPTITKMSSYTKFVVSSSQIDAQTLGHKDYKITTQYDTNKNTIHNKDLLQSGDAIRILRTYKTNTKLGTIKKDLEHLKKKCNIFLDKKSVWQPNTALGNYTQAPWQLDRLQNFLVTYMPFLKSFVYTFENSLLLKISGIILSIPMLIIGVYFLSKQ